ncbi:GPI inositol-deacylase PGAP1-like protein, partial [Thamnocephalis sphaerospora]
LNGIPVLFIHGNAGSYKQVRSLASEAAMLYHDKLVADMKAAELPMDAPAVDLNEEFTALHGQSLMEQAEYINDAIQYILSLYHERRPTTNLPHAHRAAQRLPEPTSVIIVGHSMGGIVARAALTLPNYQRGSINTLLTVSSPHIAPPAPLDRRINQIYTHVNAFWRRSFERRGVANLLHDVVLVTLAGGQPDTMINSDLCDVSGLVPRTNGFTVYTTGIPDLWSSMNHHCVFWC